MSYDEFDESENVQRGSVTVPLSTLQSMQRDLLFVQDNFTLRRIINTPETNLAGIRFSHLNRLTFLSKREAMIDNLQSDLDYGILEIFTEEEEFDSGLWFNLNSVKRGEKIGIHDSIDGQNVRALVEKRRSVEYNETQPKKKGFGGIA